MFVFGERKSARQRTARAFLQLALCSEVESVFEDAGGGSSFLVSTYIILAVHLLLTFRISDEIPNPVQFVFLKKKNILIMLSFLYMTAKRTCEGLRVSFLRNS